MARPAPADFDPPQPLGDSNRSPQIDEVKAPFAYDRRLADEAQLASNAGRAERDALMAFSAEKKASAGRGRRLDPRQLVVVGLALLAIGGLTTGVVLWARTRFQAVPPTVTTPTGTATINSRPDGARVVIDGQPRGVTPLKVSLAAGPHTVELSNGGETRTIPLAIDAGTIVSQYIDLAPGTTSTESLEVSSDPPGAQVIVDGKVRGVTPLTVAAVGIGDHEVVISSGDGKVKRVVNVAKGATASVVATLAPAGSSAGWLSIKAPIELQIQESGKVLGTTSADQIMLPAGQHSLDLVNAAFAFRTTIAVQIMAGKTASPTVSVPNGSVSINAVPWADVWLDGKSLGATPLANVAVPIGPHEILFRHPQLGERRQSITVTTRAPVRVGVELTK